jgi:hypothetical protein
MEQFEEFLCPKHIVSGNHQEMVPEVIHDRLRHLLRADGLEVSIEKRCQSVTRPEVVEIGPVHLRAQQAPHPLCLLAMQRGPCTAEEKFMLRPKIQHRHLRIS